MRHAGLLEDSDSLSAKRWVLLPVALLVCLSTLSLPAILWFAAGRLDQLALDNSLRLAHSALADLEEQVGSSTADYALWQEAFENLHLRLDPDWADANVGPYVAETWGYDFSFVLSPDDRTVYAMADGERRPLDALAMFGPSLGALAREARFANAEPGTAVLGLLKQSGKVMIAAASAISAQAGPAPPPGARSVLVFMQALDAALLDKVSQRYLLTDLHLVTDAPPEQAQLPLEARDGHRQGVLTWRAEQPGDALWRSVLPPLALALTVVLTLAGLILLHARRAMTLVAVSEARFHDFATIASDWLWEQDAEQRFTYISDRGGAILGRAPQALLGQSFWDCAGMDRNDPAWRGYLADLEAHRPFRDVCFLHTAADGSRRHLSISGKPMVDAMGRFLGYRGTGQDITAQIEAQAQVHHMALHDSLTGLSNRVLLHEQLEHSLAFRQRQSGLVAVLALDLDHFKEVNDTLGHDVGDQLIKAAAEVLAAAGRETDIVARIGGDEFVIVQVGLDDVAGARILARRLVDAFAKPFRLGEHEVLIGLSIGIALAPDDGSDGQTLLKHADIALYRAKAEGRSTYRFFERGMDAALQARKALERDLREALRTDSFEVHYQPMIAADDSRLMGVEALVRWRHPERGLIRPDEFITLAEESGMIMQLGAWVLRTACAQVAPWQEVSLAVNVSGAQFRDPELIGIVRDILAETGMAAHRLELEITEGVLIQDTKAALATIAKLKELGVHLALDDFGTGYSSLSYLQRFPFDKIKIDRSFVQQLEADQSSAAIVRAILNLGEILGLKVNAEGVETQRQIDILQAAGCDQFQGFYFCQPMSAEELTLMVNGAASAIQPRSA